MKLLFLTFDYLSKPLGIATLAAALRQEGHEVEVAALGDSARQKALLQGFRPDILCLSLVTGQHTYFLERARRIKAEHPGIIVLAGGPHPTFYPECIEEQCLDAVCRGEGDVALPSLVAHLSSHGDLPERLPNWWIKTKQGNVIRNDVGPLVANLDEVPYPDRTVFDRACPGQKPATAFVMASRGCPFDCSYCFNHAYRALYAGQQVCRRRSVSNVIAEVKELTRHYPLQIVVFQDDTFNLDNKWLREFGERFPVEVGLPFHCHLRADLLDERTARLLGEAGCLSVKLGLESARTEVRNGILNRRMTLGQFERACALLRKYRIRFATENILAVPGTTFADDLLTYEVNRRVRPQHSFATLLQLYPRTGIAAYARDNGFLNAPVTRFPGTFYEGSSVAICNKKERGRLRALFAMGVSLSLPPAALALLSKLPLRPVYEGLDRLWKGYCLRFRIYPYTQTLRSFAHEVRLYLVGRYY